MSRFKVMLHVETGSSHLSVTGLDCTLYIDPVINVRVDANLSTPTFELINSLTRYTGSTYQYE